VKLETGELSELEYWKQVMECKDYCSMIMQDAITCYVSAAASRFHGIFLFDTGVGAWQPVTVGDKASRGKTHDNERVMTTIVAALAGNPEDVVLLEGRASRVGNDYANFRLAGTRSAALREELIRRGVAEGRIHYRWLGEGEPYYRPALADLYGVRDQYDAFGQQTFNQSVTAYLYVPKGRT
jgi:hypothetical protein